MSEKELSARPNLEQYKNQAKDLVRDHASGTASALARVKRHHPRFHKRPKAETTGLPFTRTDAQLVIAREHGFESWPKFARHVETIRLVDSLGPLADPVSAFIEVACVPRHSDHSSGTLDHAELILARYPQVAQHNIYTAAILADEATVRQFLSRDPQSATAPGGPHGWDALSYLCFSRYLRLDKTRTEAFFRTARALLDSGASGHSGWLETIDQPTPRRIFESAIYGAAGIARHSELTRLLLERGADPNDEETPYHVPEGYDNTVMKVLLESGKLAPASLSCMLLRKADWHDEDGLRLILEHNANPNLMTRWGDNALHHALRRDNGLVMIEMLLDHGADPTLMNTSAGRSATTMAASRGRGDILHLFERRGIPLHLDGVYHVLAACAKGDAITARSLLAEQPALYTELLAQGGTLLAEFAGNGNVEGLECLLDLGVNVAELYKEGDGYFDIAKNSTALHVAAWRAWPAAVQQLINRGAPVNVLDGAGRTALSLAVKACVDSYWTRRRSPDSVAALLSAGATVEGIKVPCGYDAVDELLLRRAGRV